MGAKNMSAKIAQRETCPSIKNRPQAMGRGARILLGSVRLGPAERSGCLCWKQQKLISPTTSFCLESSLLRFNNENLHSTLLNTVMPSNASITLGMSVMHYLYAARKKFSDLHLGFIFCFQVKTSSPTILTQVFPLQADGSRFRLCSLA